MIEIPGGGGVWKTLSQYNDSLISRTAFHSKQGERCTVLEALILKESASCCSFKCAEFLGESVHGGSRLQELPVLGPRL